MKILSIDLYRDGGTRGVNTDMATFFILSKGMSHGSLAGRVVTNWPSKGGELVNPHLEQKIIDLADAYEAGQLAERLRQEIKSQNKH